MTKAKTPEGAPFGISRAHALTCEARKKLVSALGFDTTCALSDLKLRKCLQRVEYWLGFYPGGVAALDNAPAASVYITELELVRDNALEMLRLLNSPQNGINPFTRETLMTHFEKAVSITGPAGVAKACTGAGSLLAACNSALAALAKEKKRGQGRKKATARETVLINLLDLYVTYSNRPNDPRKKKGFTQERSEFEQGEIEFVRAAFADIGEDRFRDKRGDEKWAELIRAARSSYPTPQGGTPVAAKSPP